MFHFSSCHLFLHNDRTFWSNLLVYHKAALWNSFCIGVVVTIVAPFRNMILWANINQTFIGCWGGGFIKLRVFKSPSQTFHLPPLLALSWTYLQFASLPVPPTCLLGLVKYLGRFFLKKTVQALQLAGRSAYLSLLLQITPFSRPLGTSRMRTAYSAVSFILLFPLLLQG